MTGNYTNIMSIDYLRDLPSARAYIRNISLYGFCTFSGTFMIPFVYRNDKQIVYNFSMFENECSSVCLLFDFLLNCAVKQSNYCTSGTDCKQNGCKWTTVGTNETKHIGSKIRTTHIA